MKSAQDIISYAKIHDIRLSVDGPHLELDAPQRVLTDEFIATAKRYKAEIMRVISAQSPRESDAELIKKAFREGKPVRVWSGILKEWIWWAPSKESAKSKKSETNEVVYHMGELILVKGWGTDELRDIHSLKKNFGGEVTKRLPTPPEVE